MEFKEIENRYWNNHYRSAAADYRPGRGLPYHRHFKDILLALKPGARVLEEACGVRCDGIELALAGITVYETDIAEIAVEKARELYQKMGLEQYGVFEKCDAENLPYADDYFDGCFIAASFHHLPDQGKALAEMARVTKKGGLIILALEPAAWPYATVYRWLSPLKRIIRKKGDRKIFSIADDSTEGFTKKQLLALCRQADLEVVKVYREKYLSELYDSGLRLISKLTKKKINPGDFWQKLFSSADLIIAKIPLLNLLNWHWTIICKK